MKLIMSDKPVRIPHFLPKNIQYIDLSVLKIANCVGCFGCWTKTPGRCVIRDDATQVYPIIAKSEQVLYISHIRYGGYDTIMKTMLERAIPTQQAFIRTHHGETHHVQRAVCSKHATILAYGNITKEEKQIFTRLIERNAYNMNFESYNIIFTDESEIDNLTEKIIEQWAQ